MSLDSLMNNVATLERLTVTRGQSGGQGDPVYTQDQSAVGVMCSIQPASANTALNYLQRNMRVSHQLYFDTNWNPNTRDRWVTSTGRYFIVEGWFESMEIEDSWTCAAFEVKQKS